MSGTDYSYDEQGEFYPFFILTIATVCTVPLTYFVFKPSSDPAATAPRIELESRPDESDFMTAVRKRYERKKRPLKRMIAVVGGWALIAGMIYLIMVTARRIPKLWNPYDILGISESATEKQIKKHYGRLALKYHPDKIRPDPSKNETLQSLNDHFVEITKAYKALTDEEIRNNFIQYGHPDGKQSFSIGIALPSFIITDGNGKYVLVVYAALLGVLLPYLVGKWWYGTQRMSKENVLIESADNLCREYEENMTEGDIITSLSCGTEYQQMLKGELAESGINRIESRIFVDGAAAPLAGGLNSKDRKKLEELEGGARRKALALLWAYLGRVDLDDPALSEAKFDVAVIANSLIQSFTIISLNFGSTAPILAALAVTQCLTQAIPPKGSPLLQLPHISPAIAAAIEGDSKTHLTLKQFMRLPEGKRRELAVRKGLLTEPQYEEAMRVAHRIPQLQLAKAFFKCTGEKFIIPGSLVSLVVKGRFIPPGTLNIPEINELDLEDVDPSEDDIVSTKQKKEEQKSFQPPFVYARNYPLDYTPKWYVWLSDSKQGKTAVPPTTFTSFDQIIFLDGKPTFNMQTLKLQFQAPPQAGQYTFVMHLVCDCYLGMDTKMEVTLVVNDASKAAEIEDDDDISEPDEDSLAGQMQQLKTGAPPKKKKKVVDDSSDDESGTEEENDTSDTDTDTDTDGE